MKWLSNNVFKEVRVLGVITDDDGSSMTDPQLELLLDHVETCKTVQTYSVKFR